MALGCAGSAAEPAARPAARADAVRPLRTQLVKLLRAPRGARLDKPAWLSASHTLVAVLYPPLTSGIARTDIYSVSPTDGHLERLRLCSADCSRVSLDFPTALPDGKLGYERTQFGDANGLGRHGTTLLEPDATGSRSRKLVPYGIARGARGFSYRPGMQDGIVDDGAGLYDTLLWLRAERPSPLQLPLTRVGRAAWSPDGRLIALDGVPSSAHAKDLARVDLPRTLYVLAFGRRRLRPLVTNLADVGASSWSPDGGWLAVRLQPRRGIAGLYLVRVSDGRLYLLRRGNDAGSAAWLSPRTLAVSLGTADTSPARSRGIALLRLPSLAGLRR
jgi:hypothetical protein